MFKRAVVPKLEITERPPPTNIGCIMTPGSQFVLKAVSVLARKWKAKILVYHRVKYLRDLMGVLNRAITEEKVLISSVKDFFKNEDLPISSRSMTIPTIEEVSNEIENFLKKKKKFIDELIIQYQSHELGLLVVPIPMFKLEHGEDITEDTLGSEVEQLLRKAPKSLPLLLVPPETEGKEHTVVAYFQPQHMTNLASRLIQFCDERSIVILVAVIDTKLLELYKMIQADMKTTSDEGANSTEPEPISLEEMLKERMRALADRVIATVRPHVKEITLEIASGSVIGSIRSVIEKHEAMYLMVFSRDVTDVSLDVETEMLSRLVKNTKIFIFKE